MADVDPILAALQAKVDEVGPASLPQYLGRTTSAAVVEGPRLRFVLSAEVAYHELDLEWGTVTQLYASIKALLGDAVTAQEEAQREQIRALEAQAAQLAADRDGAVRDRDAAHERAEALAAQLEKAHAKA